MPKGKVALGEYFALFASAENLGKASHTWYRDKVVTMKDDHDQICFPDNRKERFGFAEGGQVGGECDGVEFVYFGYSVCLLWE